MKDQIINYFKTDRTHASGVTLIMEHTSNIAIKRQLNVQPESAFLTGVVHEELRRLAMISRDDFRDMMLEPVMSANEITVFPQEKEPVYDKMPELEEKQSPEKKAGRKK